MQQIYRMRLPEGDPQPLTNGSGPVFFPAWSPNGREIAMHGFVDDRRQLLVVPADGGPLMQVTTDAADHRIAAWSADGRELGMVTDFGGGTTRLRVASRSARGPRSAPRAVPLVRGLDTLRGTDIGVPAWSPDGRFLACACEGGLVFAPAAGGQVRALVLSAAPRSDTPLVWSADSRWVYYLALDSNGVTASVNGVPVAGGLPRVFVRFDDLTRPWPRYGFQVHGRKFYLTLGDLESDIWVADVQARR